MARTTNGSSDVISFGDIHTLIGTGDISVAGWFRYLGSNAYESLFSSGTSRGGGGNDAFNFEHLASSDPLGEGYGVQANVSGSGPSVKLSNGGDTNWHHWGMSWKATGTVLTGYFDGASKGTSTGARANPSVATTFGAGHNSGGTLTEFANATGADLAIWTVLLTAGEFAALAAGIRPYLIRPASLIFYAPLDGIASSEPDLSRNANNGTLTGTSAAAGPPVAMFTPRMPAFLAAASIAQATTSYLPLMGCG